MSSKGAVSGEIPALESSLDGVTAVVLTHMRPRLAGDVVRSLLAAEGFAPERIVLVVNTIQQTPALQHETESTMAPETNSASATIAQAFESPYRQKLS